MTKKELEFLHSKKCVVDQVKHQNGMGEVTKYIVSFSLTGGELYALKRNMEDSIRGGRHPTLNHQKDDVQAFLRNALERAGIKFE